jgi:hypothetical protein
MKTIGSKERGWIGLRLYAINHSFGMMWNRFEPMQFRDDVETVELEIHKNNFRIVANGEFWECCGETKRLFLICHEMCHVMFAHWLVPENVNREWWNVAQDIEVNEYLLKTFFKDKHLKKDEDILTIKGVFRHKSGVVKKDRDHKYYYDLIMQCV